MEVKQITARGESTKAVLVETAHELFAERGYGSVSIEEILTGSGVSRGALYHHFRDKRDLFRAVFERADRELVEEVGAVAASGADPWEKLTLGCSAFLDACLGQAAQQIIFVDAAAVLGWAEWRRIDTHYAFGLVRYIVEEVMDAGLIERRPVEPLAHVVLGALNEAAMTIANAADTDTARREVGDAVMFLLEGVLERP